MIFFTYLFQCHLLLNSVSYADSNSSDLLKFSFNTLSENDTLKIKGDINGCFGFSNSIDKIMIYKSGRKFYATLLIGEKCNFMLNALSPLDTFLFFSCIQITKTQKKEIEQYLFKFKNKSNIHCQYFDVSGMFWIEYKNNFYYKYDTQRQWMEFKTLKEKLFKKLQPTCLQPQQN